MAKPKKEIPRYKLDTCLTCERKQAKTVAGRCIEPPYCYERHRKDVREARNAERGKTAEIKPTYTIPKQSDKRKKLDALYNVAAAQFKKDKPYCMARLPGCMGKTLDVHHLHSGKDKLKYYLDQSTWITVCPSCHFKIHNELGKDELVKLGLKRIEA